ncbi:MAG: DUF5305 family protein [Methanosarcinaceae archaeon]|nr:DUF5305 family protein [Methanosarcinaceae archaeon]
MNLTKIKIRNFALKNYKVVFAVFSLMLIASLFFTYNAYTETTYRTDQVISSSYTHSGNYEFTAPVTEKNPLYPLGTKLEMGKPAYFLSVSPTMDMSFTYSLKATDSADVDVELKPMIVATASGSTDDGKKTFWQKQFPIISSGTQELTNAESLIYRFKIDIPKTESMVRDVQDQIKYSQDMKIELVTYVTYQGIINGKTVTGTEQFPIPLTITSSYYQMPQKLDGKKIIDTYETRKTPIDPPFLSKALPLMSLLFSFVLLVLLVICKKGCTIVAQSRIDEFEHKNKIENEYSQFKEWISNGIFPNDTTLLTKIEIKSLQDIVDAAVDMNERVIHDANARIFFVIHGSLLYYFRKSKSNNLFISDDSQMGYDDGL